MESLELELESESLSESLVSLLSDEDELDELLLELLLLLLDDELEADDVLRDFFFGGGSKSSLALKLIHELLDKPNKNCSGR